jgi:serine protease Do
VQRGIEIKSLTGDLDQVKFDNKKQLGELEEKLSGLKAEFSDFSSVIENSVPAIVSVRTNVGLGSGFIVHGDGYIVTNYHVIEGATAASVIDSELESHAVRLVGFDANADVAVLKIEGRRLPRLSWGNSGDVKVGEKVIAVGNPGGLEFTVTQGIVSAIKRSDARGRDLIQIDVPINPGNSGGPLINTKGRVVGVNTLKIAGFEGVGFALASDYVENIVDAIIDEDGQ